LNFRIEKLNHRRSPQKIPLSGGDWVALAAFLIQGEVTNGMATLARGVISNAGRGGVLRERRKRP